MNETIVGQEKPALLLLVHRIPFPPNKGDKIRSFHLLQHLSKHYRVFLGAFIDDVNDETYRSDVLSLCNEAFFVKLTPHWRKIISLRGFITGQALTLPYYASSALQGWVDEVIAEQKIDRTIAFSSAMAQFLMHKRFDNKRRIMDFIDIDSDKWAQYSRHKKWPMNWVYQREAKCLLAFEKNVAERFDASTFVSDHEAEMFQSLAPESAEKISAIYNGVDIERFSPGHDLKNPFRALSDTTAYIVFVGAMDYWPNIDAVVWFSNEVMPLLQDRKIHFYIVGSNPGKQVKDLARLENISVTGKVDDVRNYIAHADVCIAPLRIARGIQNKVLESLAMGKATIVTTPALEGIPADNNKHLLVADNAGSFSRAISLILEDDDLRHSLASAGRDLMEKTFVWDKCLDGFNHLLETRVKKTH